MASSKEYLHFILEQLSDLEAVSYRSMMGGNLSSIIAVKLSAGYMMTGCF